MVNSEAKQIAAKKVVKYLEKNDWSFDRGAEQLIVKVFSEHEAEDLVDIVGKLLKLGVTFFTIEDVMRVEEARKIYKRTLEREAEKRIGGSVSINDAKRELKKIWGREVEQ